MFNKNNFCHIASNNRNEKKAGVFVYKTTDDLETVSTSGYFNDKIVDINLHDLIIHEWHDPTDRTKVQKNVLCVIERTLDNVGTTVIKTQWEEDIEQDIEDIQEEIDEMQELFVRTDGASIMTGPLKFRAGSFVGAIAGGLGDGISIYKLKSDDTIDSEVASLTKDNGFTPGTTNAQDIGSSSLKWKDAYIARVITAVLNNGANINVPTTAGTLCLNDFSNITDPTKNIANWSTNMSNCYRDYSDNVKLTLDSDGTLRLNARSKLYVPNGLDSFSNAQFTSKTYYVGVTRSATIGQQCFEVALYNKSDLSFAQMIEIPLDKASSGTTDYLAGVANHLWLDTTNNYIKYYGNDGTTNTYYAAFPHAIISGNGSKITNIDIIFNIFGYMGKHLFTLPGFTGWAPAGLNDDGTMKSQEAYHRSCGYVDNDLTGSFYLKMIWTGAGIEKIPLNQYKYDPETNIQYKNGVEFTNGIVFATCDMNNGIISNFKLVKNHSFRAVDYEDYKNLNYLSNTGANIGNWSHNVSNCPTETPQDIKLELSSGTLTLKAGSKVYVPNGSGTFDTVTTTADVSVTRTDSNKCMVWRFSNGSLGIFPISLFYSGSTAPTQYTYMFWYDTTENKCKHTSNGGSTWISGDSFPLCIVSTDGTKISAIDQVFNGIGYVGSTVFSLPCNKGLAPNGLNPDGTLNSNVIYDATVRTLSLTGTDDFVLTKTSDAINANKYDYDPEANQVYRTDTGAISNGDRYIFGSCHVESGKITSFSKKTPFHAVDYTEFQHVKEIAEAVYTDTVLISTPQTIKSLKTLSRADIGQDEILKITTPSTGVKSEINYYDASTQNKLATQYFQKSGTEYHFAMAGWDPALNVASGGIYLVGKQVGANWTWHAEAPTPALSDDSSKIATTEWVRDLFSGGFSMPDYSQMVTLTSADNPYTPTKNGYLVVKRASTYPTISVTNNTYSLNIAHIMCGDSDHGQQTVMVPVNKNEEYAFSTNATSITFVPAKGE